jgi:uncharacterized RDD family membrane protein YckC
VVCPSCNRETQLDFFCHFCDVFLAQPRAGRRAGVSRRLAALFLDGILIWMVFGVVVSFSAILGGAFGEAERGLGVFLFTVFIAMAAYAIFALWFLAQGRTPGKWLLGIRAVDKTQGHAPGLGKMIVRETIGKFASGLVLGPGLAVGDLGSRHASLARQDCEHGSSLQYARARVRIRGGSRDAANCSRGPRNQSFAGAVRSLN